MAVNTNTTVNPLAVAKAVSALVPDSTVRDKPSGFRGLLYVPVKVGIRSPVTVYEVIRGEFEGDCQVVLAFDSRIEEAKELKAKVAEFAEAHKLKAAADPGDPKKQGWIMTCSQVLAALEGATPVKKEEKPRDVLDLDKLLQDPAFQDPAFKAKLMAKLLV